MSAGHTLLTICAMMLLTTILLNFYKLLANNSDTIAGGQDGILADYSCHVIYGSCVGAGI